MSSIAENDFEFSLITPSYVRKLLHGLHGLAFFACWFNGLPMAYRALFAVSIICLWQRNFIAAVREQPIYLRYTASQRWYISYNGLEHFPISIEPVSFVNNRLMVLRYQIGIADKLKSRSLFITRHSMPVADYRRLLVRLKLSRIDQDR